MIKSVTKRNDTMSKCCFTVMKDSTSLTHF